MTTEAVQAEHWAKRYLPAVLWPILLFSLCLELHLRSDWFAPYLFERLHVVKQVPDAAAIHQTVYDVYFADGDVAQSRFSQQEQQHITDVAAALYFNRIVAVLALIAVIAMSCFSQLRYVWMRIGACYVLAVLVALALLSTRWLLLFRGAHPLVFQEGNWDFHPNDLMVQLYPEILLAVLASAIVITVLVLAVGLFAIGTYLDKQPLFADVRWHWHKRLGDTALILGLFAVPIWISGRDMLLPGQFSWYLFYLLCLVLVAACFAVLVLRNIALGVLLLGISFLWYQAFAEGVAHSTARAQYNLQVHGQKIIDAIAVYKKDQQRLPQSLQELHDASLATDVPQRLDQLGAWQFRLLRNGHYVIYFVGPLAFEFSYHSRSDFWNAMRRP